MDSKYTLQRKVLVQKLNALVWVPCMKKTSIELNIKEKANCRRQTIMGTRKETCHQCCGKKWWPCATLFSLYPCNFQIGRAGTLAGWQVGRPGFGLLKKINIQPSVSVFLFLMLDLKLDTLRLHKNDFHRIIMMVSNGSHLGPCRSL